MFLLYVEVSDQYGTSRLAGVFTTKALAEAHAPQRYRWYVEGPVAVNTLL